MIKFSAKIAANRYESNLSRKRFKVGIQNTRVVDAFRDFGPKTFSSYILEHALAQVSKANKTSGLLNMMFGANQSEVDAFETYVRLFPVYNSSIYSSTRQGNRMVTDDTHHALTKRPVGISSNLICWDPCTGWNLEPLCSVSENHVDIIQ